MVHTAKQIILSSSICIFSFVGIGVLCLPARKYRVNILCLVSALLICGGYTEAFAQIILSGSEINKSFFHLDIKIGNITDITKIWSETFDGRRRYEIKFLQPTEVHDDNGNDGFLSEVGVFENDNKINVYDWSSPDCSIEKYALFKKDSDIYLLISRRKISMKNDNYISPQNMKAQQEVSFYLMKRYKTSIDQDDYVSIGREMFFLRVSKLLSSQEACESDDVYSIMSDMFARYVSDRRG